jgi:cytochrome c-type biogenesis protein CcmF
MIAQLGQLLLHFALLLAGTALLLPLTRPWLRTQEALFGRVTLYLWLALSGAFLCLIFSFIMVDTSVFSVAMHSHALKPLLYRISAAWGHHEGSMLLWVWMLATFTLAFARTSPTPNAPYVETLWCQHGLLLLFLLFVVFTSNPLARVVVLETGGMGLNPVLQDPALAIHPPILYAGYLGFSIPFSLSMAALYRRRVSLAWAEAMLPWVRIAWSCLTFGMLLGSIWAYRELGWGGFWFWDPVENASLMPWLLATSLLHLCAAKTKSIQFLRPIAILGQACFLLIILGTFLVRSGVLSSVHSFAHDPSRGVLLLAILCGLVMAAFAVYWHHGPFEKNKTLPRFSTSTAMLVQSTLLVVSVGIIFLSIVLPLYAEMMHQRALTITAPYFERLLIPIFIPILLLAILAPALPNFAWRRHLMRMLAALCSTALCTWLFAEHGSFAFLLYVFLGIWLMLTSLYSLRFNAMSVGHVSLGILMIGLAWVGTQSREASFTLLPGEKASTEIWHVQYEKLHNHVHKNYLARTATISVTHANKTILLKPEVRFYPVESQHTVEAATYRIGFSDLYVTVGNIMQTEQLTLHLYTRPAIWLVWIGGFLLGLAGCIGFCTKRYQ